MGSVAPKNGEVEVGSRATNRAGVMFSLGNIVLPGRRAIPSLKVLIVAFPGRQTGNMGYREIIQLVL